MATIPSKFDSVDSIVNYLRESSSSEEVSSSATSAAIDSTKVNAGSKPSKRRKKEKEQAENIKCEPVISEGIVQVLPSGRVRYGPVTVNPRKIPAKTLFTGRRSKYEQLSTEEEEKRRIRRDRNRAAATKCREKRDTILIELEQKCQEESEKYDSLIKIVKNLQEQKQHLENVLSSNNFYTEQLQPIEPNLPVKESSTVFVNIGFPSSIMETSIPSLPCNQPQVIQCVADDSKNTAAPTMPILTNTAYNDDQLGFIFNAEQPPLQTISMNSSSLDRLINSLQTPASILDNNNNNCSGLFNSAYGSSTCAQQHSSSSEDDSLPPKRKNYYVF